MTPEQLDQIESEVRHRTFSQETRDLIAAIRQRDKEIAALKAKVVSCQELVRDYLELMVSGDCGNWECCRPYACSHKDHADDCRIGNALKPI